MHTLRTWLALLAVAFLAFGPALAKDVQVKGYSRKDGAPVAPHARTSPNQTRNGNYSTVGNVNPHTGKAGTRPRDAEAGNPSTPQTEGVASLRSAPTVQSAPSPQANSPIVGWLAVAGEMPETELKRQLGTPRAVEGKPGYEVWHYPTGTVYVKDRKVVAWKQVKSP